MPTKFTIYFSTNESPPHYTLCFRMRSDLYWRIMKVLMEFEEAKRQLLHARYITQRAR
ncbi:unnamed protein product [Heligmosomoides polygyrus]|uniref:Uncharacterized protein n=1 Tax=Heligmosomoides polygyrus TaxID=6339 RepID=A0A3P7X6D6_HELPZ|nr:unnamed protein product [Heligmosomoides polygyrus]